VSSARAGLARAGTGRDFVSGAAYDLSSHEAVYLELALRKQLPIATRNEALREAAWAAGVGVLRER